MAKLIIAALLSAALIWLVPNAHAQNFNNTMAVGKPAGKVHQKVTAPAQAPKQVDTPAPPVTQSAPATVEPDLSTHEGLMTAAGISPTDFEAVSYIVSHESTWQPFVSEPTSGAYGLCQSLPGYKMSSAGDDWQTNPVTQLKWCNSYAIARYGGWTQAMYYWQSHRNW